MKNWIDLIGNAQESTESTRLDERSLNIFKSSKVAAPETDDETANRRLSDVTRRANDEKKSYGFLRSLSKKVFGKKAEPEAEPVAPRTEEDRRASVMARAKAEGVTENFMDTYAPTIDDDRLPEVYSTGDEIEDSIELGSATRGPFNHVLDALRTHGEISFYTDVNDHRTIFHISATPEILSRLHEIAFEMEDPR